MLFVKKTVLLVSAFLLLLAVPAWSQSPAQLTGEVTDQSHAAVPGAQAVLTNTSTGVTVKVTTNLAGAYTFPYVLPGDYSLEVSRPGFTTQAVNALTLHANDHRSINFALALARASQTVQVVAQSAAVPIVDSGQKSETLTSEQIQAFSTIGRNSEELLALLPGVTQNGGAAYGQMFTPGVVSSSTGIEGFNINGNRNDSNGYKLDGGDMNDLTGNNGSNLYPNSEFISELTVQTSNYTADQGGSPVLVTAVTKSGTKALHGEAYWTGRNGRFNSNDWSSNAANLPRPASKFNYPGFNLSGPILLPGTQYNRGAEKKLFFFLGTEWSRQTPDPGTQLADVPTLKMLQGDFSDIVFSPTCTNARTAGKAGATTYLNQPCQISDPLTGKTLDQQNGILTGVTANGPGMLKTLMGPNSSGPNYVDPAGNWNFAARPLRPQNVTQYIGRVDWDPSDKARIFLRLGRQDETQIQDFGEYSGENSGWTSNVPEPTTTLQKYHSRSLSMNMVSVLNPTLTNEFAFNANVLRQPNTYQDASKLSKTTLNVNFSGLFSEAAGYPIVPQIIPGYANCDSYDTSGCYVSPGTGRWGDSNLVNGGNFYKQTTFAFSDNLNKVSGAHDLKFGGQVERARNDQNAGAVFLEGAVTTDPTWTGSSSGDQFADILNEHFVEYQQGNNAPYGKMRFSTFEWYAQDSWKATRRLTLEYGARWSLLGPWYESRGLASTFDRSAYNPAQSRNPFDGVRTASCKNIGQSAVPLCGTLAKTVIPYGHPVIQPRVGFAWDTFGTGRFVVRGGLGQYTGRDEGNNAFNNSIAGSPPNLYTADVTADSMPGGYFTLAQIGTLNPGTQSGGYNIVGQYDPADKHVEAIYQYNLTLSTMLPGKMFAEAAYVGSQSRHLLVSRAINAVPLGALWIPGTYTIKPGTSLNSRRPYVPFGRIDQMSHSGNANYNALQTTLRRQATHSLNFLASYTYSKAMGQSDFYRSTLVDPFSNRNNFHPLTFDRTHVFTIGYQYLVPSAARGALSQSALARGLFGGWMLSGITKASSGGPYSITTIVNCAQIKANGSKGTCARNIWPGPQVWFGSDVYQHSTLPGNVSARSGIFPVYTCDPLNSNHGGINSDFINPGCLSLPAFGQQGFFDPPYLKTPGTVNADLALQKSFRLGEGRHLDIRISSFNIMNRGYLLAPQHTARFLYTLPFGATDATQGKATLLNGTGACSGGFGPVGYSCGKTGNREMEATVKFFF